MQLNSKGRTAVVSRKSGRLSSRVALTSGIRDAIGGQLPADALVHQRRGLAAGRTKLRGRLYVGGSAYRSQQRFIAKKLQAGQTDGGAASAGDGDSSRSMVPGIATRFSHAHHFITTRNKR